MLNGIFLLPSYKNVYLQSAAENASSAWSLLPAIVCDNCGNVEGRFEIIGIYDSEEQAENVAGQFPNKSNIVRVCLNTLYDGGI